MESWNLQLPASNWGINRSLGLIFIYWFLSFSFPELLLSFIPIPHNQRFKAFNIHEGLEVVEFCMERVGSCHVDVWIYAKGYVVDDTEFCVVCPEFHFPCPDWALSLQVAFFTYRLGLPCCKKIFILPHIKMRNIEKDLLSSSFL